MEEIWKDIRGYEGLYEVSSIGRVRTVTHRTLRRDGKPYTVRAKLLTPCDNWGGYMIVTLHRDSKQKSERVHRLVAEAFIPNPKNLPVINHKDANKANNQMSNSVYRTKRAKSIICQNKMLNREIAEIVGVGKDSISDVLTGKTWSHVE